jgi:hypothetical protein
MVPSLLLSSLIETSFISWQSEEQLTHMYKISHKWRDLEVDDLTAAAYILHYAYLLCEMYSAAYTYPSA